MSDDKQWRHAMGVCAKCKKEDSFTMTGRWYCAECAAEQAARARERRRADPERFRQIGRKYADRHRAAGLCRDCSRPAADGRILCTECLLKNRRRSQENRDRQKQEGRITDQPGRCRRCGEPAEPGFRYCEAHHRQIAEHLRAIRPEKPNEDHPWKQHLILN